MKKIILFLSFLTILPSCMQLPPLIRSTSCPEKVQIVSEPTITIWVHGTRLLPKNFFKKFFHCLPGLNHYKKLSGQYHIHKIANTLINQDQELFSSDNFYIFGWSGSLSRKAREQAAQQLYDQLKSIRTQYKITHNREPKIRIIAHSHGGNVCLLLDKVKNSTDKDFCINELILLATPVQQQTQSHIASDLFKKVYSLYSILDIIQIADPQGLHKNKKHKTPLFSERLFPHHEKIKQVAIKLNNRSLMHIEFVQLKFLSHLSHILKEMNNWTMPVRNNKIKSHDKHPCLCINTATKQIQKSLIR